MEVFDHWQSFLSVFFFPRVGSGTQPQEGGNRRNSKQRTHHCHDDELRLAAGFFFGGSFLHKNTHIAQRNFFGVFRGGGGRRRKIGLTRYDGLQRFFPRLFCQSLICLMLGPSYPLKDYGFLCPFFTIEASQCT